MKQVAKYRAQAKQFGIRQDRLFVDDEMREEAYWKDPENFHIGFQRFEELMKELRVDYDNDLNKMQAMMASQSNNILDKNNRDSKTKKLKQLLEMNMPKKTSPFLDAYAKNCIQELLRYDSD